jgi:hypothetical protein
MSVREVRDCDRCGRQGGGIETFVGGDRIDLCPACKVAAFDMIAPAVDPEMVAFVKTACRDYLARINDPMRP